MNAQYLVQAIGSVFWGSKQRNCPAHHLVEPKLFHFCIQYVKKCKLLCPLFFRYWTPAMEG